MHVNREPDSSAQRYRTTALARRGKAIDFGAFPGDAFSVSEILGPETPK